MSCEADGAFVGSVPLLQLSGEGRWEPRDGGQLSKQLSSDFGVPVDLSSKMGGLKEIAKALNADDLARAQIAAVLLGIPDPPLAKSTVTSDEAIRLIRDLHWSGLLEMNEAILAKAGFNPDQPRNECGEWTSCGASESAGTSSSQSSPVNPAESNHETFWESVAHGAEFAMSEIARAKISESEADLGASATVANNIVSDLKAYAKYRAKPWINSAGIPVQVPIFSTGDPFDTQAHFIEHELFEPNAPLMRPGTNADWIDDLVDFGSIATLPLGADLDAVEIGGRAAAGTVDIAADAPFLIPRSEVPDGFDYTWRVGSYKIPTDAAPETTTYGNLVHDQIGRLVQDMFPDVKMTLRTAPSQRDWDIEIPADAASQVGFRYAEIKPVSDYGFRSYTEQVARWKLPEPVLAISYDYQGNICYGFPW